MTRARDLANASAGLSAISGAELGYLDGVTSAIQTQLDSKQAANANVSTTELGYLDGVTSAIQTQLNAKQAVVSGVSDTEISYLDGVTSAIQTQLNAKQPIVSGVSDTEISYLDGVTSAIQTQLNNKVAKTGDTMSGQLTVSVASGVAGDFKSASNSDALRISSTSTPTKFITLKPEVLTNVAQMGYWTGSGWGPVLVENGGQVNTPSIRNIYMSTSAPSGGNDGDVWIQYT